MGGGGGGMFLKCQTGKRLMLLFMYGIEMIPFSLARQYFKMPH